MDSKPLWLKIVLSFIILIVCITTSAIAIDVTGIFLALMSIPIAVHLICAVTLAPIIEEYAKRVALVNGFPWVYVIIFAGAEAVLYIVNLLAAGVTLDVIISARCMAIIMHFSTMIIQTRFKARYDKNGRVGTNWEKVGFYNAICLHAGWNALCLLAMNIVN